MSKRGYHLNATGRELSVDMACPSTIEPFKLDKDAEEFFYDELNALPMGERLERIIGVFERNKQLVADLIVENNPLGRALMQRLPDEQFVVSVKRPGTNMHWMYTIVDRMKPVPDEWLKEIIEADKGTDRDFVNVWTGQGKVDQGDPNYQPMAEIPNDDARIVKDNPGVNYGALPTDEDMTNLAKLEDPKTIEAFGQYKEGDIKDTLQAVADFAKVSTAIEMATAPLKDEISRLRKELVQLRTTHAYDTAGDLFEKIKHGDEKHQDWLKAALYSYFSGRQVMTEEELTNLNETIARGNNTGEQKPGAIINAAPPVHMLGTEDRSAIGMRLPTNVQWVDEQGKPKP